MSKGLAMLLVCLLPIELISSDPTRINVEDFLAAETLGDLGLRQQELEKTVYDLLDGSVDRAPELAGKILPHAHRLIRYEQSEKGGWYESMWNGWSHTGSWLQNYLRSHPQLETLGVAVRTFRENSEGSIANSGFVERNQSDAMAAAFNAAGGNYRPGLAMERLAVELLAVCGSGRSPFLIPDFFKFNYHLRPAQRRAAQQWAAGVAKTDPLYQIAEAFLVGTALLEVEWKRQTGNNPVSGVEAVERAKAIIDDDSLSLAWRGGFAAFLGNESVSPWGDQLGISTGKVIAKILETETPFSSISFSYAFPVFLRSNNHDPEWRETANRILMAWEKRNRLNRTSKRVGRAFDPNNYWVIPILELACRTRDEKRIDNLIATFSSGMHVAPGAVIHLVTHRYYQRARKMILNEIEKREYSKYQYARGYVYNIRLHEKIPAFLDTFDNDTERDYAALHLAGIVDPEPFPKDAVFPNREERLRDLLNQGTLNLPPPGVKRKRALEMLALAVRNPAAGEILAKYAPMLGPVEEQKTGHNGPENLGPYWGTRAAIFSELEELEKGYDLPLRFQLGRVSFDESPWFNGNRRRVCSGLLAQITMRLETAYSDRDVARLKSYLPIGRLIAESIPLSTSPHDFLIYLTGAHALMDEMPAYEKWWQTLNEARQKDFAKLLVERGAYITYNGYKVNPARESPESMFETADKRRRYMKDLLSNPWTGLGYHDRNSLAYAESRALLTEEDIYALAEPLAKQWPRRGCACREWFGSLADQGRLEEALMMAEKKFPQSEQDNYFKECLLWERTLIKEALGHEKEAGETLAKLHKQTKKSGFRMKGYGKGILAILEKRLAPAPQ